MTIYELRGRAAELETEIEKILQEATKEFHKHECPRNIPYDKDYCDAWNKVVFLTDVRNGFKMAETALQGLELIEEGGKWN